MRFMGNDSRTSLSLLLVTVLVLSVRPASTSLDDHRYEVGDYVPLFANKVGPLNNPSETYQYFDLPFCRPDHVTRRKESLGEVLNGDRLTNALYELRFREEKVWKTLCEKNLTSDEVALFRKAVSNDFYFQMYYDDLPLWGFLGKVDNEDSIHNRTEPKYFLFKHVQFDVLYNKNQVIEISAFCDPNHAVDITKDVEVKVKFTYSVFWNATSAQFGSRMYKYSRVSLLPKHQQIHWFSIVNSLVIIVLLMGLFTMIFLQHLKNDLMKCSVADIEENKDEVGWKYIHGDVFRYPRYASLFCAFLGAGTQLLILVCFLFVLAFVGILYPYNRGALSTSLVVIYALTSVVAGYSASVIHSQLAETGWEKTVFLTGILYLGPVFLTFSVINFVAISYRVTAALPFGTIIVIFLIWILVTIPLLLLGGKVGSAFRCEFQAPCDTKKCPREIPLLAWYWKVPVQMFLAGLLPFSAIVLELHHVYASLWGYKIYTVYTILFFMFIVLITLTAILSIVLTYLQLSVEDHKWWWRSILRGSSTSLFMFGYSIYFYARSNMSGLLQLSFFFGYSACICYAFSLMLGTVSFYASFLFVRRIYHAIKCE